MAIDVKELEALAAVVHRQAATERMNAAAAAAVGGVCEAESCDLRLADARALERTADLMHEIAKAARRSHLTVIRSSDLKTCAAW